MAHPGNVNQKTSDFKLLQSKYAKALPLRRICILQDNIWATCLFVPFYKKKF